MALPDKKNQVSEFPHGIITWDTIKPLIARNRFLPEAELRQQFKLGFGIQRTLEEMNHDVHQLPINHEVGEVYRVVAIHPDNNSQLVQSASHSDYHFPGNAVYMTQRTRYIGQIGAFSVSRHSRELKAVQVLQFLEYNEGVRFVQTREKLFVLLRTVNTASVTNLVDAEMAIQNAWQTLYFRDYRNELLNNAQLGFSVIMASDVDHRFLTQLHIAAYSGGHNDSVLRRIA